MVGLMSLTLEGSNYNVFRFHIDGALKLDLKIAKPFNKKCIQHEIIVFSCDYLSLWLR